MQTDIETRREKLQMDVLRLSYNVGEAMKRAQLTCATAESCTGGLVGHLLTEADGSSAYFAGGAIVYSYEAKEHVLGVQHETLMAEGAVSYPVAREMAQGARQLYGVGLAVSVTGVAGPSGGSEDKPVGTVFVHLSAADGTELGKRFLWGADRTGNKLLSAQAALQMILDYVNGLDRS